MNYRIGSMGVGLAAFLAIFFAGLAANSTAPAAAGETPADPITINYSDWTAVLKESVMATGRSDRLPAVRVKSQAGTKLARGNPNRTRLEANRVFFHALGKNNITYIRSIRDSLAGLPDEMPLSDLSKNERLAYWLNLQNVTAYLLVAEDYPVSRLKGLYKKSWPKTRLTIAGKAWSLADIEAYVVAQWQNPLVIYGFYSGAIGSPNLGREAYSGENVWARLEENAVDFIGSLRGVQFRGDTAYVSRHYELLRPLWADFDAGLLRHLRTYGPPEMQAELAAAQRVKATLYDWYIADLYNGHFGLGTAANTNSAAFVLSLPDNLETLQYKTAIASKFPRHVRRLLFDINQRRLRRLRDGQVTVEEYVDEAEATEAPKAAPEPNPEPNSEPNPE
jgi:Protein of unknown function, DUF547